VSSELHRLWLAHVLSSALGYFAQRLIRCGQCGGAVLLDDVEQCVQRLDVQERISVYANGELTASTSQPQVLIDFTAKTVRVRQQVEVAHRGAPVAKLSVEKVAECRGGNMRAYARIDIDEVCDGQLLELLCDLHPYYRACDGRVKTPLSEFVP